MFSNPELVKKFNPFKQFLLAVVLGGIGLIFRQQLGGTSHNDWYAMCFGLLGFLFINPMLGIFCEKPAKYLLSSLAFLLLYIFLWIGISLAGLIDKLSVSVTAQSFLSAEIVFYVGFSICTQVIRQLWRNSKNW
jgi:hypothetical protein